MLLGHSTNHPLHWIQHSRKPLQSAFCLGLAGWARESRRQAADGTRTLPDASCPALCCAVHCAAGKTFLLNRIIQQLREEHGEAFSALVAVTASTGIAATHIQVGSLGGEGGGAQPVQSVQCVLQPMRV